MVCGQWHTGSGCQDHGSPATRVELGTSTAGSMRRDRQREQIGPVGPPGDWYHPINQCRRRGALSPDSARPREELDPRHDPEFDRLVFSQIIREARSGYFYLHGVPEDTGGSLLLRHPLTLLLLVAALSFVLLRLVQHLAN